MYVKTLESLLRCLAREEQERSDTQTRRMPHAAFVSLATCRARWTNRGRSRAMRDDTEIWMMLGLSAFELGRDRDVDLIREAQEAFSGALARYYRGVRPEEWRRAKWRWGRA